MAHKEFEERMLNHLLPQFCSNPSQDWTQEGFKQEWHKICDQDAIDFLRGLDGGLIKHVGHGLYLAPKSSAKEMFFWVGLKKIDPRPITIWAEPIITVAVLARLYFDLGWPIDYIGMQSKDWAFDVVTFRNSDSKNEHIACEVKKTAHELNALIRHMRRFGGNPLLERPSKAAELNAYRKVIGLRLRQPPIFWAVGPNTENYVFKVIYSDGGMVEFREVTTHDLRYSSNIYFDTV